MSKIRKYHNHTQQTNPRHCEDLQVGWKLIVDLFLFSYERTIKLSLSDSNQADVIEAYNVTLRYLVDLHYIDNPNLNK